MSKSEDTEYEDTESGTPFNEVKDPTLSRSDTKTEETFEPSIRIPGPLETVSEEEVDP